MDTTKGLLIALTCLLASACASTPKSYMLVPSRTTVPELEKLSRQSGTTVDVLTVNREERRFLLDAGDGAVLTGHDLDVAPQAAGANPVVRFLWKSTDYGDTFTRIDRAPGAPAGVYLGFSGPTVTVDPHHHRTVYFPDSGNVGGLWRSLDAGNTWTEVGWSPWEDIHVSVSSRATRRNLLRQFQHPLLLTAWLPSATCRPVSGAGLIAQRTCQRLPALQAKPQWRQRTQGQQRLYARVRVLIPPWDPDPAAPAKTHCGRITPGPVRAPDSVRTAAG